MLIEKISAEEMTIISAMREIAIEDSDFLKGHMVNNNYWLRFWEYAKENSCIATPFIKENSLILKKKICSVVPDDTLLDKMYVEVLKRKGASFQQALMEYISQYNEIYAYKYGSTHESLHYVFDTYIFTTDAFVENTFNFDTIEFKISEKDNFKINHGCKLMKILGKLAKIIGQEKEFEEIRLRHSQIMNDAKIESTLCLSIHPLDYMTASYNDNNWHSCMNWLQGEYRRGVIEMMNSNCVVVAYLESAHDKLTFYDNDRGDVHYWNSKKWREFFIVRPNYITGIKGYPYWNRNLEDTVLFWLKDLYKDVFNSKYSNSISIWSYDSAVSDRSYNVSVDFDFNCGPAMYNDFYQNNYYHMILTPNVEKNEYLDYSGESECVICGGDNEYESESDLTCQDCVDRYSCCKCGENIYRQSDLIVFNGRAYCPYCYEELPLCSNCEEPIDPDCDDSVLQFIIAGKEDNTILSFMNYPLEIDLCPDCARKLITPEALSDIRERFYRDRRSFRRYNVANEIEIDPNFVKEIIETNNASFEDVDNF